MFNKTHLALFLLMLVLVLGGCGQPEQQQNGEQEVEELQSGNVLQLVAAEFQQLVASEKITTVTASEVFEKVVMRPDPEYYVVDLRPQLDFLEGSIVGAVNIPFPDSLGEDAIGKLPIDKKLVLVCEKGNLANQLAVYWGMLGFEVMVLNNGMEGWRNNPPELCQLSDLPVVTDQPVLTESYQLPEILIDEADDVAQILQQLGQKLDNTQVKMGLSVEEIQEIVTNQSEEHLLVDIRAKEHYEMGHIPGAVNIPMDELVSLDSLAKLPRDKEIVLICYSGNQANRGTMILNLMGYDVISMAYGMSDWTSKVDVIGVQPTRCAWVSCYADDNFARGFPVYPVECEYKDLPTVVTRLQFIEEAG